MRKLIQFKDIVKEFDGQIVLKGINLDIYENEFVTLLGPSGCGKTTLLRILGGFLDATEGEVLFDGEDISKLSRKAMTKTRLNKMGFVFQQMYMMKKLNIMDNIVLPGYQAKRKSRADVNKDAETLMRRLGIIETADRFITEVSGGQLQRACLCRSLINNPKMIFADEPTGALNQKASMEVISELVKANREGTSVMMVTHSEKVASCSERVIFLVDGNIEGELKLGKMQSEDEIPVRERKLRNWLQERDW